MATQSALRYEIAPVEFEYGTNPDLVKLNQMQGFTINPGAQDSRMRVGGSINSQSFTLGRAKPTVNLTTRDLLNVLNSIPFKAGLCVTKAKFNVFERGVCNAWTGAGIQYLADGGGLAYIDSISCAIDDTDGAMANLTFIPFWDHQQSTPLEPTPIADISAFTPAYASQYFMGPIYINGRRIDAITNITFNSGLTVSSTPSSPGPFDDLAAITDSAPSVTLSETNLDEIVNLFYGESGEIAVYFQAGDQFNARLPLDSPAHVKLTATTGKLTRQSVGGDVPGDVIDQLLISVVGAVTASVGTTIP